MCASDVSECIYVLENLNQSSCFEEIFLEKRKEPDKVISNVDSNSILRLNSTSVIRQGEHYHMSQHHDHMEHQHRCEHVTDSPTAQYNKPLNACPVHRSK